MCSPGCCRPAGVLPLQAQAACRPRLNVPPATPAQMYCSFAGSLAERPSTMPLAETTPLSRPHHAQPSLFLFQTTNPVLLGTGPPMSTRRRPARVHSTLWFSFGQPGLQTNSPPPRPLKGFLLFNPPCSPNTAALRCVPCSCSPFPPSVWHCPPPSAAAALPSILQHMPWPDDV